MIYTASRDRLIKVWHCNYPTKKVHLLADLDEHADWVNQIILDEERQLRKHK